MSALDEAQRALDDARAAHAQATSNLKDAQGRHSRLISELEVGDPDSVTADDLAQAHHAVERAQIVAARTEKALQPAQEALNAAAADAFCDDLVQELHAKASELQLARGVLDEAVSDFTQIAAQYDALVDSASNQLRTRGLHLTTSRVEVSRFAHPTVDRIPLRPGRGSAHLAASILPGLQRLKTPQAVINDVRLLAAEVSPLPTN